MLSVHSPRRIAVSDEVEAYSGGGALRLPVAPARHPVADGLQMKARNPVAVWLVWPVLTLGIYHLVWYYKIHREMAEFDRRRQVPVAGPMLVLLLLSWTIIAP